MVAPHFKALLKTRKQRDEFSLCVLCKDIDHDYCFTLFCSSLSIYSRGNRQLDGVSVLDRTCDVSACGRTRLTLRRGPRSTAQYDGTSPSAALKHSSKSRAQIQLCVITTPKP